MAVPSESSKLLRKAETSPYPSAPSEQSLSNHSSWHSHDAAHDQSSAMHSRASSRAPVTSVRTHLPWPVQLLTHSFTGTTHLLPSHEPYRQSAGAAHAAPDSHGEQRPPPQSVSVNTRVTGGDGIVKAVFTKLPRMRASNLSRCHRTSHSSMFATWPSKASLMGWPHRQTHLGRTRTRHQPNKSRD